MTKKIFTLAHDSSRWLAQEAVRTAPVGYVVRVSEPSRTLDQNAAQWPILEAFSEQKTWTVNGQAVKLEAEEWKDVLTAAFQRESVRMALALDGRGMVMLGGRTSKMSKATFSEYMEFLHAAAVDHGVTVYRGQA